MSISITPMDTSRPDFAGLVSNNDLRQPLRPEDHAKIEAGMDRFAVLAQRGAATGDLTAVAGEADMSDLLRRYFHRCRLA